MKIYDPVFGDYVIPEYILPLIETPVIQRLRWVKLSNISSLNYPMVAGISRFAHSIGVCVLADRLSVALRLNSDNRKTLMAAGLLHDAGIPPLGHLMEEALSENGFNYDHEERLRILLLDEGDRFVTLPDGKKNGVLDSLQKIEVSGKNVFETVKGKNELGNYIASNIDLDNIDNIIRVYISIYGFTKDSYESTDMAINYFLHNSETHKETWEKTRARVYHRLMFSIEDFAQKATMKRLLRAYLSDQLNKSTKEEIIEKIQFLNDDEMMVELSNSIQSIGEKFHVFSGEKDRTVCFGWVDSIEKNVLLKLRKEITEEFPNHYLDFIPDKRIKYSSRAAQTDKGALVGLFSNSNSSKDKKEDKSVVILAQKRMPKFIQGKIPNLPWEKESKSQLSLF